MNIALIPARCHSVRIPNKNIKELAGHPLIAYAIISALKSGIFKQVWVSSDSREYLDIAEHYGAIPLMRPFAKAENLSPDIDWVNHALNHIKKFHERPDAFSILRPTAPFRTAETIKRAWEWFLKMQPCDSIRAIEMCKQHPYKMWQYKSDLTVNHNADCQIVPFMESADAHNYPYQALPRVYIQNASLEIAWTKTAEDKGTISGDYVKPFHTQAWEGYDINENTDWTIAEILIKKGVVECQRI